MGRMGTAYESAKGIVFLASDNTTLTAGSAVVRRQRGAGARLRSAYIEPRRPIAAAEDHHLLVVNQMPGARLAAR